MEILDTVDEDGNLIGTATKEECHADSKLIHQTVHFSLVDSFTKRILLTIRSRNKAHDPGKICFLGEHVLSGETLEDGVRRGVVEELGFKPKRIKKLAKHLFRQPNQTELVTFFVIYWDHEAIIFDKDEIEEIYWIDVDKIKNASNYSDMTKHWVDTIGWSEIF